MSSAVEVKLEGIEAKLEVMRKLIEGLEERLRPEPMCFKYPEAAKRLGIGVTKLKSMVKSGQIRKSYLAEGGDPMISLSEIQRVSAPVEERPKFDARQRAAAWQPIQRKKAR